MFNRKLSSEIVVDRNQWADLQGVKFKFEFELEKVCHLTWTLTLIFGWKSLRQARRIKKAMRRNGGKTLSIWISLTTPLKVVQTNQREENDIEIEAEAEVEVEAEIEIEIEISTEIERLKCTTTIRPPVDVWTLLINAPETRAQLARACWRRMRLRYAYLEWALINCGQLERDKLASFLFLVSFLLVLVASYQEINKRSHSLTYLVTC